MTPAASHPPTAPPASDWSALPAGVRYPRTTAPLAGSKPANIAGASPARIMKIFPWHHGFFPQDLRQHFFNVYAYCRISDDLGDEVGDTTVSLQLLDQWETELNACYDGHPRHPVFVALAETVRKFEIPKHEFSDLLAAFRQDQRITRYETFDELLGYCRYSANPVGHLVLYLCGYRASERQSLSDYTCTALQLANFWQDVTADFAKGRIYLPLEDLRRFGVSEESIRDGENRSAFREMMKFEVERAREWFAQGLPLIAKVDSKLAIDIELFSRGGQEILNAIERQHYSGAGMPSRNFKIPQAPLWSHARRWAKDVAGESVSRNDRCWSGHRWRRQHEAAAVGNAPVQFAPTASQLDMAYSVCRSISRSAAKNFYYGFVVLPKRKRNALSAVYAFMRRCDDIVDDRTLSREDRHNKLADWLDKVHRALAAQPTDDPVLLALTDAQRKFQIPIGLLDQLAFGTAADLDDRQPEPAADAPPAARYQTFEELCQYCYGVASVVGLVCIKIFGYRDPAAEPLAERCGLAFQLTNIIRDVKEDVAMGRVYFPQEDLAQLRPFAYR